MESFLSTLPPYVHDFLNKHPPTDVFNVLRELVCFAVLYSNDRERIAAKTKELLDQGADVVSKDTDTGSMGGQNTMATSNDNDSITTTTTAASKSSNTAATGGDKPTEKKHDVNKAVEKVVSHEVDVISHQEATTNSNQKGSMPWTFPDWWGHHDGSDETPKPKAQRKPSSEVLSQEPASIIPQEPANNKPSRRETVSTWVPWDEPSNAKDTSRRMQRSMSKPIPDLRSYLEKSTPASPPLQRRATSQRASAVPAVKSSSGSTTPVTQQQRASKTPSSAPMSRTSSTYRPKQTATVRARAERAKAQQQEIEERKQKAAQLNNVSLRLKQQAKSTIDWDAIKKERRRTMPVMPSTK
ncbi:hypothetical protein O0I10_012830 [Lichtheimia ornata]|uniref:Uncharacterized protein n=1 Tax=Lichtheimia ornata TaxID=688661 RepID=A0AAD7XVG1_9FUNG|nr:uncharacterized protein O0I10_012830 [Lichtheimia ornata]KAJ8651607.1 hypothetical protein O0I10_012830 [Lichtheimia ornata]